MISRLGAVGAWMAGVASVLGGALAQEEDRVTLSFSPVRGATSYRVYKRAGAMRKPLYTRRRKGGWIRNERKFKGSAAAKRAARQAQVRAKDAGRPGRARKHAAARAHGLALQWYRRWESGMPVSFAMLDAVEEGFGVYVQASRILLKRLGPAYNFAGEASRRVVQLQGPPSPIRPAPFVRRTRSA